MPEGPRDVRVVGRYALCDRIAGGGMATVHLGRLLGQAGFSRTVAIKRLHAHLSEDPELVSMFIDEARLAARIHHPNVVATLDVVARESELFLVMEYVHGESLAAAPAKQGLSPVAIVLSGVGLLGGVGFAYFGLTAKSDLDDLRRTCAPTCGSSNLAAARQKALFADISLGVGVVALGAAAWVFFAERAATPHPEAGALLDVTPTRGGAVARIGGPF